MLPRFFCAIENRSTNKYVPAGADTSLVAFALAGSCGRKSDSGRDGRAYRSEDACNSAGHGLEAADRAECHQTTQQRVFDEVLARFLVLELVELSE